MNDEATILQVQGLGFSHPQQPVFAGWSARVGPGATLVQGGDSSGKTTLLRLLAGALAPAQGHLVLNGSAWADAPQAYRRQVFWMDPRSDAIDPLTVRDWLQSLPAQHAAWDAQALADHVQGFGLEEHLDKGIYMLSTGSKRKMLMAAGLASGAPLTLFDEPVAGLDRASVRYLCQALADHAAQPGRAIVVAHYEALAGVPWRAVIALPELG
ncbi:MAG: ATP-binding cassette domain-containing protein [Giesbergeria sp.]|nr:ATP-binding cassette domain-containing protein [Giesbergeria sp.]